jgi:hypothetical protein
MMGSSEREKEIMAFYLTGSGKLDSSAFVSTASKVGSELLRFKSLVSLVSQINLSLSPQILFAFLIHNTLNNLILAAFPSILYFLASLASTYPIGCFPTLFPNVNYHSKLRISASSPYPLDAAR